MIKLSEDLRRWFKEKWTAQDGSECGDYKGRGRVKCRPSRKVSDESPETWSEMSPKEKKKAVRLKQKAHREGKQFSSHKSGKTWDGKKNKYRPKKKRLKEMFEALKQLLAEAKEKKPYKGFKKGKNHPEGGLSRAEARRQGIHAGIETKEEAKRKGGFGKLSGKTQKRRKSFCARMCGMKRRRTSAKTARDPKSKINAALRVWGCKCGGKSRKQVKEEFIGMILEKKGSCWSGYKQDGMKKKGGRMVPNCVPTNESVQLNEGKNKPKNKKLWAKAKALARQKFDVYPSAYANGWAAKWYKKKGGTWVSENLNYIQQSVKEKFLAEGCGCGGGNKPKPKPRPVQKPKGNDLNEEVKNEAHRGKMSRKMIKSRDARAKRLKGVAKVVVKGDTPLNAQHRLATYIEWKMKKGKKKKGDAD